jgi:carboxypeptidase Taq
VFSELCKHARETALIQSIQSVLEWDDRTQLPPAAGPYRADQVAYLAGLVHARRTSPQVGEWLSLLAESPLAEDPTSDAGANVARLRREYDKKRRLPLDLVERQASLSLRGQQALSVARRADNFAQFLPVLQETVRLKREEAAALGYDSTPYDPLLDDYEPGATTAEVASVLADLGAVLRPLLQSIVESSAGPDGQLMARHYPLAAQREFGVAAARAIGFDFAAGRLDVSDHPFCATVGPRDVRLTTRYREDDFGDAFFSILHEAGHGLYEQGLPEEWFGLPLGSATSLGMHESQSRMWENQVGRSRGFWEGHFPAAQRAFPEALGDADWQAFYRDLNRVAPSLIRVDADEVTYNLHIFIRFELERALLEDDLQPADLPGAWREKYQQHLGVVPPNDADGVLQDVHWSAGLFGYFPTYTLGNLYAAQLFAHAQAELGDLPTAFRQGEFAPLLHWLRTRIHVQGSRYFAGELVRRVTGQSLSAQPWLEQMRAKYGEIYRL